MALEDREHAAVVRHQLARHVLTELRGTETGQEAFRTGLVRLGRICGVELLDDRFETEPVEITTPLAETTGERIAGLDDVVVVSVLRAATPFVEGLLEVIPGARQGFVAASRDESAGIDDTGAVPVALQYGNLPDIRPSDTVIVADPMLATGSTMTAVLEDVVADAATPTELIVLAAVSAPTGLERVSEAVPSADIVTVAIDDHLDDDGFIVPGLGDAGDRSFGTN